MNTNRTQKLNVADVTDGIERGYAGLDAARASALTGLLAIRRAKASNLQRELDAARESGDRTAADLAAMMANANSRLVGMLNREVATATTKVPTLKKNAAIVHGYVWQVAGGQPGAVPNARVVVFAAADQELGRKLGEARSNGQGYYKIAVPVKAVAEKPLASGAASVKQAPPSAFVAILRSGDKEPSAMQKFPLVANTLSFRELILVDTPKTKRKA